MRQVKHWVSGATAIRVRRLRNFVDLVIALIRRLNRRAKFTAIDGRAPPYPLTTCIFELRIIGSEHRPMRFSPYKSLPLPQVGRAELTVERRGDLLGRESLRGSVNDRILDVGS